MSEQGYAVEVKTDKSGAHEELQFELNRLTDQLEKLEVALTPVLNPPSPNAVPETELRMTSPLRDHVTRLSFLNRRLTELLERIDL